MRKIIGLSCILLGIIALTGCSEHNARELKGLQQLKPKADSVKTENNGTSNSEKEDEKFSDYMIFPPGIVLYFLHETRSSGATNSLDNYIALLNQSLPKDAEGYGKNATIEKISKVGKTIYMKVLVPESTIEGLGNKENVYFMQYAMDDYLKEAMSHDIMKEAIQYLYNNDVDLCFHFISNTTSNNTNLLIRNLALKNVLEGKKQDYDSLRQ